MVIDNSTTPYVATLPCNLSLIACFLTLMFHKVTCQHMQGVVGFLAIVLLQIYWRIGQRKKIENQLRFDRDITMHGGAYVCLHRVA